MSERIIVIGAGVSGLSTGIHARRCGFEVEIFEHHTEPGGVCTGWTHGDYTIDGCIHWLMGTLEGDPYHQLYELVGALDGVELRTLELFTEVVDELSGERLRIDRDLDGLLSQVEALSPPDLPVFRELVDIARASEGASPPPVMDAPELMSPWAGLVGLWRARDRLSLMFRHFEAMDKVAARVRHPTLRFCLGKLFLPDMPKAFMAMLLGELERGNLSTVVGGSQKFSQAMARRFTELGGTLRYGADVERVLVEDDRAVGVRLIDGSEHRADHVVSTAPGPTTVFRMLGGHYTDARLRERYADWPIFNAISLVNFGVRKRWPENPTSMTLRLAEPLRSGPDHVESLTVRNMFYDPSLAPEGASIIQVLLESNFDFWHDVHHAPARYRELKGELAEQLRRRLEPHFPGLREAEDFVDVATPYTFWRYARSYRGAFEGWMPTVETVRTHPDKTLPGLSRFHMAGQWVEPGGGIPPSVSSGRHVVQLICKEHRREFTA